MTAGSEQCASIGLGMLNRSASTPGALPFLRTDLPGYQHCRHSRRAGERVRRGLIEALERI